MLSSSRSHCKLPSTVFWTGVLIIGVVGALIECPAQLRRTKESMISVALQLQVSIKLSREDEHTISSLLTQTEEAKAKELIAKSKAEEATSIVNQLNLEINALKRRLHSIEADRGNTDNTGILSIQQQLQLSEEAEAEVESMLNSELHVPVPRSVTDKQLQNATPFDRWKMNQFLYASDTPAASEHHDNHVVDMLIEAATLQLNDARKLTATTIGKLRKISSFQDPGGLEQSESPWPKLSPTRKTDRDFFLSDEVEQMWGARSPKSRIAPPQGSFTRINGSRIVSTAQPYPRKSSGSGTRLSSLTAKGNLSTSSESVLPPPGRQPSVPDKISI